MSWMNGDELGSDTCLAVDRAIGIEIRIQNSETIEL
jgi:hypothetical protein